MVSPSTHFIVRLFFFLLLTGTYYTGKAQCNPPDQLPSIDCSGAPLVCLTNACYETLNNPLNCCNGWCGSNTAIHNPEFFQFIPVCPDVVISIHVDYCTSGNGLQSAIVGACPWTNSDVIDCDPGTPPGGTMVLTATGLVVGQVYWLLIDGSAGATCNYTIDFTSCIFEPGLTNDVDEAEAIPGIACQGYDDLVLTASPPVGNAHGYYWVLGWSGDTITSTLETTTIDIPPDLDPGVYEICMRAFSGCDTMDTEVCFEVEVYEIPPEEKPLATYCPEEFPFNWGSVDIDGPGMYEQTFTTPEGCAYDSTWEVEIYPEVPVGFLDTLHCEESLFYEGDFYDAAGAYPLDYPNMGLNGCDSTAELNVTLAAIDAFIELSCENGEFVLSVLVQSVLPTTANLEYEWYESGVLVSTDNQLYTLDGGVYDCIVQVITPAGSCFFPLETFAFNAADFRPDPPDFGFLDTLVCAQSGVFFEVIVDPFADPLTYTWSVNPATVPLYQDGSNIAELDFSNAGPTEVCVFATNDCGDGPPTCINVDIKDTPIANFSYDLDLCADSTTTVTFTGSASPQAEIVWDFSNPTTITGSGIGPYDVSWSVPGAKVITLTVIEPGCDTSYNSGIVTVTNFIAPVVNCSSTINSVTFDWDDVTGASGYMVSINGGPPTATANSTWTESSLTPGTMVNMTLIVVSAGACDDIVVTAMCTAQDCPPPVIEISGQDSACLNSASIIDLDVLVNGNPGAGTWAGPGIVDANLGLFDPAVATAGVHQVTYTEVLNNCPSSEPYLITVFDSITADFTIDPIICITDNARVTYTGNATGTAFYDYTFTPATVVSGSGAGPYDLNWSSAGTKTVRLQVSENGCFSDIISQNTDVIATLNPALINCAPNTSGVLFTWTTDPVASSYDVNTLIGPPGTPSGNSMNYTGLVPGDTVQIEIISYSAGPCPDISDTLLCIARQCPMPVIAIAPVSDICLYPGTGTADLQVTITNGNGGTGDWSGPGVTDAVNGTFDPVLAGAGSHPITYHYLEDGCDFFENITINVYDPPGAFISTTSLIITCTSGSLFLDGSGSSGGAIDYFWTTTDGVIVSGTNTAIAEVNAPGVYQLLVTGSTSGCKDSTSVTVSKDDNIPDSDAGPDKLLTCDSLQFVLVGNSEVGPNITYDWSTTDGNISGPTDGIQAQVNKTGTYTLVVTDTSTGCAATDQAVVNIDTAVAILTLTPGDTIDCNTPMTTATSNHSGIITDYTYQWSTTDGAIEGSTTNPDVDVSQGGTYTLSIKNIINGCSTSEDVVIEESDEIIDDVEVTVMHVVCHGQNNGTLVIESVTGGAPDYIYDWSVSPNGGTMLSSLPPGQYGLTVTDQNGCSITESYTITEPDEVTLDIGPNQTVAAGDSVSLVLSTNLTSGAIDEIEWSGYDGIDCHDCVVFEFIATISSTISAMITDMAGCTASDSMRLTVIVPRIIFIPNVFSPNDDGINDRFFISGRFNLVNVGYLRIFDRWGNQIFEDIDLEPGNEQDGWDGTFDGEPMQPGVYVYVASLEYEDGFSESVKGEVTIVR